MFAIAKFGSSVRQETDSYSDQDLLIVCSDQQKNGLYKKYLKKGYSITTLTQIQLEYMQKSGALFIQHLKLESVILFDEGGLFERFLGTCDLIPPSHDEISLCERTINKISMIPENEISNQFKADFLYCVSRDYFIKCLAVKGSLAFGVKDLRVMSSDILGFNPAGFDFLLELRKAKSEYREGVCKIDNISFIVKSWLQCLSEYFNIPISENCSIDTILNVELEGAYEKLRMLEYYYMIARYRGYIHPNHSVLIGYITKPNLYGAARKSNKDVVDSFVNDLRKVLEKSFTIDPWGFTVKCGQKSVEII